MSGALGFWSVRLRVLVVGLLIAVETAYFGTQCAAAFARLMGKRAYFSGDSVRAWSLLDRADSLGADRLDVLTDRAEVLLFGLDQQGLGAKPDLPFPAEKIPDVARGIVSTMLATAPYRGYFWSLATDVFTDEALALRRSTPLDLSTLSDDPLGNLLPQEWLAVAALQEAARREPRNYLYDDLLSEQFAQWGLIAQAAPFVRRAVALYPVLEGHVYLARPHLEPEIVDAAVAGFDDAVRIGSMVPDEAIEVGVGRFLLAQARASEGVPHFLKALAINPGSHEAEYWYGVTSYLLEDYEIAAEYLSRATVAMPDEPYLWFRLGQARLKLGRHDEALEALRRARELDAHQVPYFHALAEVLEKDGSLKDAERQYQAAANLNAQEGSAWAALLGFYERHPELSDASRQVCSRLRRSQVPEAIYRDRCGARIRSGG
jgi:tetratricopeptide (TPR) repeat protein